MKKLITSISEALSNLSKLFSSLLERKAKREEKKEKQQAIDEIQEARKSVSDGDEEALNRILEENRQKRVSGHSILPVFIFLLVFDSLLLLCGCITKTKTLVIPADRAVVRTEMGGVKGWFVPDATMADLVEDSILLRQGKDKENEKAVE